MCAYFTYLSFFLLIYTQDLHLDDVSHKNGHPCSNHSLEFSMHDTEFGCLTKIIKKILTKNQTNVKIFIY